MTTTGAGVDAAAATGTFTLVVLPDTQEYLVGGRSELFAEQTAWIARNLGRAGIAAVLHVGDVVDATESVEQWEVASAAMGALDGKVPVVITTGNHDLIRYHRAEPVPGALPESEVPYGFIGSAMFDRYFPRARYEALGTFEGTPDDAFHDALGPSGTPAYFDHSIDNSYQLVEAGGIHLLLLALTFGPSDDALVWANRVVAAHPDHLVVLVTHDYLGDDDELRGSRICPPGATLPCEEALPGATTPVPGHGNNGLEIWQGLVSRHANIRLVVSGHVTQARPGGSTRDFLTGRKAMTRPDGSRVVALFANYQTRPDGGGGYLRLLDFDLAQDTVSVRTFTPSPSMDGGRSPYLVDRENEFTLEGFFSGRYVDVPASSPFAAPVDEARRLGLMNGFDDGTFRPDQPLDRQAAAIIVYRARVGVADAAGSCQERGTTSPFPDVPDDNPFSHAIERLAAIGLSTVFAGGTFHPHDLVTREELAAFLYRPGPPSEDDPADDPADGPFADVPATNVFAGSIRAGRDAGVLTADEAGRFLPGGRLPRAEAAAIIVRYHAHQAAQATS